MIQDIFPHKYDVTYKNIQPSDRDLLLIFSADSILCRNEKDEVIFPTVRELTSIIPNVKGKARFLFTLDNINYFDLPDFKVEPFDGWSYLPKEEFRGLRPIDKAFTLVTALQIHRFYSKNTFCGTCGAKMHQSQTERAMICPDCQRIAYPQICPSVIVGITDGDKLLVTRYANRHSKFRLYALVAGYNEVGETLEDTVRREVMEEVGLSHWSIIRTRLKTSIFGIFWLVVLERHKAFLRPPHQNLFKNTRFSGRRILRLSKIVIIEPKTQVILSDWRVFW